MSHRIKVNESTSSLLEDALSSVTRSTRRNLIIFSALCLIVSKTVMHSSSDFIRFKHKRDVYNLELARQIDSEIHTPPDPEQEHFSSMFESDTGYKSFIASEAFTNYVNNNIHLY